MSCENCGREIKNYGVFLGGVRCPNYCRLKIKHCYHCGDEIKNLVQNHEFHQDGFYCSENCLEKEMKMMESWQQSLEE